MYTGTPLGEIVLGAGIHAPSPPQIAAAPTAPAALATY